MNAPVPNGPTPGQPLNEPKRGLIERFHYGMWGLAERMDWNGCYPRAFWSMVLRYYDRRAGYGLEYDERR